MEVFQALTVGPGGTAVYGFPGRVPQANLKTSLVPWLVKPAASTSSSVLVPVLRLHWLKVFWLNLSVPHLGAHTADVICDASRSVKDTFSTVLAVLSE